MNKKIWIVIVVVILLVAVAVAWTIGKKSKIVTPQKTEIVKISDIKMLWPGISADQKTIYYFSNAQEPAFFKLDVTTQEVSQISEALDTPDNVLWSPDFSKAILSVTYDKYVFEKYGSPYANPGTADQTKTKWVYDFGNQKLAQLNSDITNLIWLDNDHLIYSFINGTQPSINKALFNDEDRQVLANLENIFVESFISLNDNQLFFIGTADETRNLYQYTLGEKEPTLKIKDVGDQALISSDNSKIILEQSINNKTILYWTMINNPELIDTSLSASIDLTCWLNQDQFITDVKNNGSDKFYVFDTTTNKSAIEIDLRKISVDKGNFQIIDNNLFFTSKDILYRYELKNL